MEKEWQEGIWIAIEAALIAFTLTFVSVLGSVSREVARQQQEDLNTIAILQEYRKYSPYDNTKVYPQDIISIILQTKGEPVVRVQDGANTWNWTKVSGPTAYNADDLSAFLPVTGQFDAKLVKDLNGTIVRLEFRR